MASNTITNKKTQLKEYIVASAIKAVSDFIAIINKVVPTAVLNGSLARNMRAGRIKNPPPIPTKPVSIPMRAP